MKNVLYCVLLLILVGDAGCFSQEEKTSTSKETSKTTQPNPITLSLPVCTELPMLGEDSSYGHASSLKFLLWPEDKRILYISFISGSEEIKNKVEAIAKEWERCCGMTFDFHSNNKADISIDFQPGGSWSFIGISSAEKVPSMNLGWLNADTKEEEFRHVVLHEFGHALGLIHEHQNPKNNPIQWNKDLVIAYYQSEPNHWSLDAIERNIFKKYQDLQINGSTFDSLSIMLYAFPKEFTRNGYTTHRNFNLSEQDKEVMKLLYP